MSKPISFGFGRSKTLVTSTPIKKVALSTEVEHDDEAPKHEIITGFDVGADTTSGHNTPTVRVIENAGNSDWRTRGQRHDGLVLVEKNEVSTVSGLQFAAPTSTDLVTPSTSTSTVKVAAPTSLPQTADEEALAALLDDGSRSRLTKTVIATADNTTIQRSQVDDFQADMQSRPDSSTLADYAAMPVEEFGLAMLRGMGKKRRANGEIINLEPAKDDESKKRRKQEGFLGIGAKAAPGADNIELGAWGKADMRKNNRGEGFFTPLMVRLANGETITEEELEKRKAAAKTGEQDRHQTDDGSREASTRRRSRSTERRSRDYNEGRRYRDRDRDRSRDRYRDKDNDNSKEKHKSRDMDRDRDRNTDKHKNGDRDRDKYRDRDRERERERDKDSRRSRDISSRSRYHNDR